MAKLATSPPFNDEAYAGLLVDNNHGLLLSAALTCKFEKSALPANIAILKAHANDFLIIL